MTDYVGAAEVAAAAFFVVLAAVLLIRYRQASERISESSELGHDLWQALEGRLKKQDERILDLLGRLEILQARSESAEVPSQPVISCDMRTSQQVSPAKSVPESRTIHRHKENLDDTEKMVLRLLSDSAKSTIEIKQAIALSREHTARLLKSLYERGLAERDDSQKPFVYRLTEAGKRYLA